MAGSTKLRRVGALKVNQWLKDWNSVEFNADDHRRKPEPNFYIFSIPAIELRSLCGISRRDATGVRPRAADLGIQRQHDKDRSKEIHRFVEYGFPWSTLSDAKRRSPEFNNLRKPGWLPTSIVVNILQKNDLREGESVSPKDLITVGSEDRSNFLQLPYEKWNKEWQPSKVPPLEVIDGQHRLWAFSKDSKADDFEVPVVAFTFASLKPFFAKGTWLGKGNSYAIGAVEKIESEINAHGALKSSRHLAQYIAASSYLHCIDGWSYLGRAAGCVLRGDPHRALHLGYYAELRAALALMATQGIGIFSRKHFLISGPGQASHLKYNKGTHDFAWECLENWAGSPVSGNQFASIISPEGRPLADWVHPIGGPSVVAAQASEWFLSWGMDLHFASDDKRARNESTYRPDGIPRLWKLQPADAIQLVEEVWTALEPTGSRFESIDRQILRLAIERAFFATRGKKPGVARREFRQYVKAVVDDHAFDETSHKFWMDFLLRISDTEDHPLFEYSRIKPGNRRSRRDHAAIIARATLLLRIATGAAHALGIAAGMTTGELDFWHASFGEGRGLWPHGSPPAQMSDLWADVDGAIQIVNEWRKEHQLPHGSFQLPGEMADAISHLSSCERVALWGMS